MPIGICANCGVEFECGVDKFNRGRSGKRIFCCMEHFYETRRKHLTKEEKVAKKSAYDLQRRNGEKRQEILDKKKDHFKRTYDPVKAAEYRKKRMAFHVEYCRRPEYKEWKKKYDEMYNAKIAFGEYAEAALILEKILLMIDNRAIKEHNGLICKSQKRKRAWLKTRKSNLAQ